MFRPLVIILLGLAAASAQQTATTAPQKAPPRALRILPLGEPPPFQQDVRDGVRYELEPPPGSVPPRQIRLGEGETAVTMGLHLGRPSESIQVPAGTLPVPIRVATDAAAAPDPAARPWLTLHPPDAGNLIALLWREPGKTWLEPRAMILPDSAEAFPAGTIRIVNLLPTDAALIFGPERVIVPPGKTLTKAITVGTDIPIQIAFKNKNGELQGFYSGSILLNAGERAQVFLHRADSQRPRQPAKAVIFNEAAPAARAAP